MGAASAFYLILTPDMRWCPANVQTNRSQRKTGAWLALFPDPEKNRLMIMIPFVSITDMQIYVFTKKKNYCGSLRVSWKCHGAFVSGLLPDCQKDLSYHLRPDCIVRFLMSLTNSPKSYVRHAKRLNECQNKVISNLLPHWGVTHWDKNEYGWLSSPKRQRWQDRRATQPRGGSFYRRLLG